jgi:tetratricopeptide (TPR) repeat protein
MTASDSAKYYHDIYSVLINIIYDLEREGFLRKTERAALFSILKNGAVSDLRGKVGLVNLVRLTGHSISKRYLMMALASDMNFDEFSPTESFYRKAVESDRFDIQNYLLLAKFYRKNCRYDEAIDTLLTVSSMAANSSHRTNLSDTYKMLADLYMAKRDYENALAHYVNSLVILDFKEKDRDKAGVLTSLGDIMMIRGNNLEAINYYKYALSVGRLRPKAYVGLLLKLSDAYYSYGNYLNGLKFATMAANRSRKTGDRLLYSKSKYLECLNHEYLGDEKKAADACLVAINEGERHREEVPDYQSHMHMAYMLDFSSHSRNPELAIRYLDVANGLIKNNHDVYRKVLVMEKLANLKSQIGKTSDTFSEITTLYRDLDKIYRDSGIGIGCCNSIISGFIAEQSGVGNAEALYLKAERELKNTRKQLSTLYCYMADFYGHTNRKREALFYARKALEIDSQIYRFDHHYIGYAQGKVSQLLREQEE